MADAGLIAALIAVLLVVLTTWRVRWVRRHELRPMSDDEAADRLRPFPGSAMVGVTPIREPDR